LKDQYKKQADNLTKKIEQIEAKYATYDKNENDVHHKSDGMHFWKGKNIISLSDWCEIVNFGEVFAKGIEGHQNTEEALQYFPDDYSWWLIFPLGVQPEYKTAAAKWYLQYIEFVCLIIQYSSVWV
jgi:hypothetical protein